MRLNLKLLLLFCCITNGKSYFSKYLDKYDDNYQKGGKKSKNSFDFGNPFSGKGFDIGAVGGIGVPAVGAGAVAVGAAAIVTAAAVGTVGAYLAFQNLNAPSSAPTTTSMPSTSSAPTLSSKPSKEAPEEKNRIQFQKINAPSSAPTSMPSTTPSSIPSLTPSLNPSEIPTTEERLPDGRLDVNGRYPYTKAAVINAPTTSIQPTGLGGASQITTSRIRSKTTTGIPKEIVVSQQSINVAQTLKKKMVNSLLQGLPKQTVTIPASSFALSYSLLHRGMLPSEIDLAEVKFITELYMNKRMKLYYGDFSTVKFCTIYFNVGNIFISEDNINVSFHPEALFGWENELPPKVNINETIAEVFTNAERTDDYLKLLKSLGTSNYFSTTKGISLQVPSS